MKKYSIIILILCSWAMSLFAISCSDQESKPQPFLEIKKDTVVFAQEAANTSIVVNTNIAWQANVPSSGNWCTVQGADDLLSISVEKNTGRDLRSIPLCLRTPAARREFPSLSGTRPFLPKARLRRRRRCRPSSRADIKPRGRSTRRPS